MRSGVTLAATISDGLGTGDDPFDENPAHWIARMELTMQQLRAMQPYIALSG